MRPAPCRAVRAGLLTGLTLLAACAPTPGMSPQMEPPLTVVPHVDFPRYMGTWYEIARYPHAFEEGCVAATADYRLLEEGGIEIINRCRESNFEGPLREAHGTARVVDPPIQAKLKVQFVWPFEGDYWIIGLAPDYRWAVVATPGRDALWVLSRTPRMAPHDFTRVLTRIEELGFDLSRLKRTPHPAAEDAAGSVLPSDS